jgi:uncharacterized protein (TIGR03086 family)
VRTSSGDVTGVVEHLGRQLQRVARLVDLVPTDGWVRPTPCPDWDVRALVNHVAVVTEKFTRFARGEDGLVVEDRRDWLGAEPAIGFREVVDDSGDAWAAHPEALDRTCLLPFGDFDGTTAAAINLFDAVVHEWDLATALGGPWQPADGAVEAALLVAELLVTPEARASGQFGPERSTDSTPHGRLLALTGRPSAG